MQFQNAPVFGLLLGDESQIMNRHIQQAKAVCCWQRFDIFFVDALQLFRQNASFLFSR